MNKLHLTTSVRDAIVETARATAPEEACGLLGGTDGEITAFYALTNTDAAAEHYSMSPEEQFAAVKDMRAKGVKMLGIWHSHPVTPARMSAEDLKLAYTPDVVYVIISLAADEPDIRAFTVADDVPTEIPVSIGENRPSTNGSDPDV